MTAHWTYEGSQGPEYWGDLDPAFVTCKLGRRQSPINIMNTMGNLSLGPLIIKYQKCDVGVINNGHTIQANYEKGSTLVYGGRTYELAQFHFHSPSEHLVRATQYDMEAHLVHKDPSGRIAVIGVLMTEGMEHPTIADLWRLTPASEGKSDRTVVVNANDLLPVDGHFYAYDGSLTTPPCSEDVSWILMKEPIEVSREQIETFVATIGRNARPIQPLNERDVEEF
jgi:carbonic anhydrase